jgi:Periplasmic binding protein-like domain
MALALRALNRAGRRVPENVGVAGFDKLARQVSRDATNHRVQSAPRMGATAIRLLLVSAGLLPRSSLGTRGHECKSSWTLGARHSHTRTAFLMKPRATGPTSERHRMEREISLKGRFGRSAATPLTLTLVSSTCHRSPGLCRAKRAASASSG